MYVNIGAFSCILNYYLDSVIKDRHSHKSNFGIVYFSCCWLSITFWIHVHRVKAYFGLLQSTSNSLLQFCWLWPFVVKKTTTINQFRFERFKHTQIYEKEMYTTNTIKCLRRQFDAIFHLLKVWNDCMDIVRKII